MCNEAGPKQQIIVNVDHDHEDLKELLSDLAALIRGGGDGLDHESVFGEARQLLKYFGNDMQAHFEREERDLFPVLSKELTGRSREIHELSKAHLLFTELVGKINTTLEDMAASLRTCQDVLKRLDEAFSRHSEVEKDLAETLNETVVDPQKREALRERLKSV